MLHALDRDFAIPLLRLAIQYSTEVVRAYAVESLHCVARRAGDKPRSLANSKVKVNFKGFSQTPFLAFVWLERAYTQ